MKEKGLTAKFSLILLVAIIVLSVYFSTFKASALGSTVKEQQCWWENWVRDKNHNKIDDLIERQIEKESLSTLDVNSEDQFSVFIHYKHHPNEQDIQALQNMKLQISYITRYINVICVRNVSAQFIYTLANLPNVVRIELQPHIYPRLDVSVKAVKARNSELYSPNTAWELGYTGKDIVVAVLDTGVDDEHEFLRGKFVAGFDCSGLINREINPDDTDGHGTHVASIIMSTGGATGLYKGVAPDAKLVDVKVLSERGINFGDQLIRGIEWVIANKDVYKIKIINLSVASDIEDPDGTSAISQVANQAVENGIIVIAAAGNEGPNSQTLLAPSVADNVICVTALDDMNTVNRNDDVIAYYSSRGPRRDGAKKPDVCAPGSNIIGAKAAGTGQATNEIVIMSGTSMAAPHVTGLAALILEANPNLSPFQVKEIILETAEDKGVEGWDPDYGWGEIDAYKAVSAALSLIQVNQPPKIVSVISNTIKVHRVVESFTLEATVIDDRTPSENLTATMFVNDSLGNIIKIQMKYENVTNLWVGIYTPNASAPLGIYSAYILVFDGEGEGNMSETYYFTVLNNPPLIVSVDVDFEFARERILVVAIEAFDHEGLANASLCFRNNGQWLNFTKTFYGNSCIFEVNASNFKEGLWQIFILVNDMDNAKALLNYGKIMIPSKIPVLTFLLAALAGAAVITILALLLYVKKQDLEVKV